MLLTCERDTLSFVADVADIADVADVTFVIGINLSRELPEYGRKVSTVILRAAKDLAIVLSS